MLALTTFGLGLWTTWVPLGAGAAVTSLVLGGGVIYKRLRWQRRLADASREEDLPWGALLVMLEERNRKRAAIGLPPQEVTEREFNQLVTKLAALPDPGPRELPEDHEFLSLGGDDRRTGHRRWGNPTEVHIHSLLWIDHLHGLVVNRSTGGLGIFADKEVPPGTPLKVRAAEAPQYVPSVLAELRHCRKVGKGFFLGCQFNQEVPWNVRVWFG